MRDEINENVKEAAKEQINALLNEHWGAICKARDSAAIEASRQGKDKFSYPVNLTIKQEPKGSECDVQTAIGFSVATKDATEPRTVDAQPNLPMDT